MFVVCQSSVDLIIVFDDLIEDKVGCVVLVVSDWEQVLVEFDVIMVEKVFGVFYYAAIVG